MATEKDFLGFVAGVLDVAPESISLDTAYESIPEWDSVMQLRLTLEISSEFDVDPRKSASLLDIFSCVFQGVIPYGAQLLSAAALTNATIDGAGVSSMDFVPYVWYVWVLLVFALVDIFIPYADKTRKAK